MWSFCVGAEPVEKRPPLRVLMAVPNYPLSLRNRAGESGAWALPVRQAIAEYSPRLACKADDRRTSEALVSFLQAKQSAHREIYVILDNHSAQDSMWVQQSLAANPHIRLHYTRSACGSTTKSYDRFSDPIATSSVASHLFLVHRKQTTRRVRAT
jgi:hypothetical protein